MINFINARTGLIGYNSGLLSDRVKMLPRYSFVYILMIE